MTERARALHTSPWQGVLYVTGGGAPFLSEVLSTPGASATVLEARVPYANLALTELLGRQPEQATSTTTALQLATTAYQRAHSLGHGMLFGFGCTAALATNREKKGKHRAHWAFQTPSDTYLFSAEFSADREQEEAELLDLLWMTMAHALHSQPLEKARVSMEHASAREHHSALLERKHFRVCTQEHDGTLILPGSFNPAHEGHHGLLAFAERKTGLTGAFEIAVKNADKPALDYISIEQRLASLTETPVWLTNTPNFSDKARLFEHCTFILGVDTLERIADLRFYGGHWGELERALQVFDEFNTRFLVFGRSIDDRFVTLDDLVLPDLLRERCEGVTEDEYRLDISSTHIRTR